MYFPPFQRFRALAKYKACGLAWLLAACLSASASPLGSLKQSSMGNELLFAGSQTVVTASRSMQPLEQAPAAVTVITQAQLERYGAVTLPDILRYVVGMDVSEMNAGAINISLRGFNSQYTNNLLILLDNRPINELFNGGIFWQIVPVMLSQIKRIEIVRGPGSVLYGANAYNGVINIITKTPQELVSAGSSLQFRTVLGGYKSDDTELLASTDDGHGNALAVGFAYNHAGGFGSGGSLGVRDNYAVPFVSLDAQHKMERGVLRLQAGDIEYAGNLYEILYFPGIHSRNTYLTLRYDEPKAQNPLVARLSFSDFKASSQNSTVDVVHSLEGEIQKQHIFSRQQTLVYGLQVQHTELHSDDAYPGKHYRDIVGLYAQDEWKLPNRWIAYLGLRFDQATAYGSNFSPRVSIIKELGAKQTLRVAYGTSFQAPTLLENYLNILLPLGPGLTANGLGNPNLKAITLNGVEVDWRKDFSQGFLQISGYYNSIQHLIGLVPIAFAPSPPYPPGVPSKLMYMNVGNGQIYGLEVECQADITKKVHALFNYAFNNEHFGSLPIDGNFAPNHMANLGLELEPSSRWEAFLGAHLVGSSGLSTFGMNTVAPGYVNMDIRLGYRLREGKNPLTIAFLVHNLFADHHIELPSAPPNGLPAQVAPIRTVAYLSLTGRF